MEAELYYTAPSDEIFEEVKEKSIEVWEDYDNTYGYVDEKRERIKPIPNVKDNLMYMVAMFDSSNQYKLSRKLSAQARAEIRTRMLDGGTPVEYIYF